MKVSFYLISFFASAFCFSVGYARICDSVSDQRIIDEPYYYVEGTNNVLMYVDRLNESVSIGDDRIRIPCNAGCQWKLDYTYRLADAKACLKKLNKLVTPNTSYTSLEIRGPSLGNTDLSLQFFLVWKFWGKTESVDCPVKSFEAVNSRLKSGEECAERFPSLCGSYDGN